MPTVRGWLVLLSGGVVVVVGLMAGYRELVPLGLAAVVGVAVAAGWVGVPPPVVADRSVVPDRVSRGEACQAVLDLYTSTGRRGVVTVTEQLSGPAGDRLVTMPARVRGGLPTRLSYLLPTDRRGVLTVGPLRVGRRDPLGLCAVQRRLVPPAQVLIRPQWHDLAAIPLGAAPSLDGLLDTARHGSITFHALREYRPGDELRRVHWRTSARLGELMVREHIDTALPRLAVLVDDRAESYDGDPAAIEEVADAAASVVAVAGRDRLPFALVAASRAAAATTVDAGLDLLARLRPTPQVDLAASLRGLQREYAGDTLVVLAGPAADLGPVLVAHDSYAALVVGLLGAHPRVPRLPDRAVWIAAATAAEFADRWNRAVAHGRPRPGR
jgi:uncharacterized protein (DUF58 family)